MGAGPSTVCRKVQHFDPIRHAHRLYSSADPQNCGRIVGNGKLSRCSEDVRIARDQAPEVKSDSRYVRFVIAKHSPERVLETGLRMEALEKNRCNGSAAAQRPFSLVRFVGKIPRKVGLFRLFRG